MKERVGWLVSFLYCGCLLIAPDISNFVNQASGLRSCTHARPAHLACCRLWITTGQDWFSGRTFHKERGARSITDTYTLETSFTPLPGVLNMNCTGGLDILSPHFGHHISKHLQNGLGNKVSWGIESYVTYEEFSSCGFGNSLSILGQQAHKDVFFMRPLS